MTPEQADTLALFAHQAMPKSSDAQAQVLRSSIEKYPEPVVADAIMEHASGSEFISTPKILEIVRDKLGVTNSERMEREALERLQRAQDEAKKRLMAMKVTEHPTITQALDFCHRADPAQLAEWRAEVEAASPFLARQWAGKPLNTAIAAVIYSKFGRIPRECWKGAVA